MTAMTCSRVTPAFTVRMTITPVIVGEAACAWAADGRATEAAPIRVSVSASTTLRIAFIGLVFPVTAVRFVHVRCRPPSSERLSAIIWMSYEAELHSQAGRARWRGGVPQRRPSPQLSQSGRRAWRNALGDQPGGARARGARRRNAFHPHHAQCRPERSRCAISRARKTRFRGCLLYTSDAAD